MWAAIESIFIAPVPEVLPSSLWAQGLLSIGVWFSQKSQALLRCAHTTTPESHGAMTARQTHVR